MEGEVMFRKTFSIIASIAMVFTMTYVVELNAEPTGWMGGDNGASTNMTLSLSLTKKYFMNVDKTEDISGFSYDIDTSGAAPTIRFDSHLQEIAGIDAISNDKTGYVIKVSSSGNGFKLKNSDAVPAEIAYSLQVASGTNHTGSSSVNTAGSNLISVGTASAFSELYVDNASLKINIPQTDNLFFDNTVFTDTLTLAIAAE